MIFEQLGTTAIRPEAPAGDDVKGEPDFEALELEIGKLANPAASKPINWQHVVDLSAGLLANKGKDLRVACYLAYALYQTRQFEGLNQGLKILADMLTTFWETMYPPVTRIRGRRNAIEWWLERTNNQLRAAQIEPLPLEEISRLKQRASQIDSVLKERDPDGPALEPLLSTIRSIPAQEVKSAIPATVAAPAEIASSPDPEAQLRAIMKNIQLIAAKLLEADVTDARLFRLSRVVSWIGVQLPPAKNGITKIPAPPADIVAELAALEAGEEDPAKVVRYAEARLLEARLWLDLNRVSAQALSKLGEKGAAAELAIKIETAGLLRRLPGIETLSFAEGKPLADDVTRKWLEQIAPTTLAGHSGNGVAPEDTTAETWRKIEALGAGGKLLDAAREVDHLVRGSESAREELIARVRLCEIFVGAKTPLDPRPYFEPLLDAVDHFHLEEWDPELALRALSVAFRGAAKTQDKDTTARRAELLKRIASISSSEALKLSTAS